MAQGTHRCDIREKQCEDDEHGGAGQQDCPVGMPAGVWLDLRTDADREKRRCRDRSRDRRDCRADCGEGRTAERGQHRLLAGHPKRAQDVQVDDGRCGVPHDRLAHDQQRGNGRDEREDEQGVAFERRGVGDVLAALHQVDDVEVLAGVQPLEVGTEAGQIRDAVAQADE